ncbi:MAG: alpha/beta hydrolase [Anaerolineae bacterium]|jgi:pimeloyl-ACP methyl ester carboxylesterase|nr:alpha/beta hydrolase [Anaerolineae bacterium]
MFDLPLDRAPWEPGWVEISAPYLSNGQMMTDPIRMGYWRISNPGKPKLLFLHGWAEYALDMARLAEPFYETCDLLALDARAHGLSDGPPSQYTMIERVQDIVAVLTKLNYHPDIFIGHSLGANTTIGLSLHFPGWVSKVVLLDPSWNTGLEVQNAQERAEQKQYWDHTWQQWNRFSVQQLLRFADHTFPDWHPQDRWRWVEGKKMLKWNTLNGYDFPAPRWDHYVDYIDCKGIVVIGDEDNGGLVTKEIIEATKQRWPGLMDVVEIPGADHYVHHYAVKPIQDAILKMLER